MKINGHTMRKYREERGYSLVDLAQAADMSVPWVVGAEKKTEVKINRHIGKAIASYLKADLGILTRLPDEEVKHD